MPRRVWCWGDSNGAGHGLAAGELPFVHWVGRALDLPAVNRAQSGSSLGLITQRLIEDHWEISRGDLVLITVPPDSRWYAESEQGWRSLQAYQREQYLAFLADKTLRWFQYHHALFLYCQQCLLRDLGVTWLWLETYGNMRESNIYGLPIDWSRSLSDQDCMTLLSGRPSQWKSYPWHLPREHHFDQDGPDGDFDPQSPYFMGTDGHPNEAGHRYLAQLIVEHPLVRAWQMALDEEHA